MHSKENIRLLQICPIFSIIRATLSFCYHILLPWWPFHTFNVPMHSKDNLVCCHSISIQFYLRKRLAVGMPICGSTATMFDTTQPIECQNTFGTTMWYCKSSDRLTCQCLILSSTIQHNLSHLYENVIFYSNMYSETCDLRPLH